MKGLGWFFAAFLASSFVAAVIALVMAGLYRWQELLFP